MPVQAVKINVGRSRDYKIGSGHTINLLKLSIAIFHLSDGSFRAVHNRCPKGGDLVNSAIHGDYIFCPHHDCKIHMQSGELKAPSHGWVETFPTEVEDGFVYLTLA
ncbi:MAG: Rieske 2Fe-2S domain-containing protein [Anaerobacillus sp.]